MKHAPPKRRRPPLEAIATARKLREELLEESHRTVLICEDTIRMQTHAMATVCRANELKLARWRISAAIRRQLEKRLWDAVLELLALEERDRGFGYSFQDVSPILEIRRLFA